MDKKKKTISSFFARRLLLIFLITYFTAGFIAFFIKSQIRYNDFVNESTMNINYYRMSSAIDLHKKYDDVTNMIMAETHEDDLDKAVLRFEENADEYSDYRLFLLDQNDRVLYSNVPGMTGQDLSSMDICSKMTDSMNFQVAANTYLTYLNTEGIKIGENDQSILYLAAYYNNTDKQDGVVLIGIDPETNQKLKEEAIRNDFVESKDDDTYKYMLESDGTILKSLGDIHYGENISVTGIQIDPEREYHHSMETFRSDGKILLIMIDFYDGIYYLCGSSLRSLLEPILENTISNTFVIGLCFFVLYFIIRHLVRRGIIDRLKAANASMNKITEGDLSERVNVRDFAEFEELSEDVNKMVDKLKALIAKEAARIDQDLAIAEEIQRSSLPSVFPPFPEHKEFSLFASMKAARVVGGDFYDYYMVDEDKLGFLIADVSGKSIPGAMFMMRAKSVIKSLAEDNLPLNEVFTRANKGLYENNETDMFVTAWMGYLELKTGILHAVNAGHNPPILIRDGKPQFVRILRKYVLGGAEDTFYMEQQVRLKEGDILFLYTDGVTEGNNPAGEMYGEERLKSLLSFGENGPEAEDENGAAGAVCRLVSEDLERFTEGAEQFDDITMLCIHYIGRG
ncbi:MAG: SpoIIE family protein phosphatase [Lachnospiraceae bacterium]|nr:SpoIIE family protein phosphatase [Lachnospiraceae bacterium]